VKIGDQSSSHFEKGDHFIVPSTVKNFGMSGNAKFIVSHPTI
jgi:mannose-6-phosphate isomerase